MIEIPSTRTEDSMSIHECFFGSGFTVKRLKTTDTWVIVEQGGQILSHAEFGELVEKLSRFYQMFTPDALEDSRNEMKQESEKRKEHGRHENRKKQPRKIERGYIYLIQSDNGLIKIGKSKNPVERIDTLRKQSPTDISLLQHFEVDDYHDVEKKLHGKFQGKREMGEWFRLNEDDISEIRSLL